jgi:NaMN:DMB phosphoribosyltransferase
MLDVVTALDALHQCAKNGPSATEGCYLESVITTLNLPGGTLGLLRSAEAAHRLWPANTAPTLTLGAVIVLGAAHDAARDGASPLAAYEQATEALSKYLYILPRQRQRAQRHASRPPR